MADQEEVNGLRVFRVMLPMRVKTSSKKKQALNLNVYRNLHHRSLHAQKKKFEELAKKLLRGLPPLGVITLHYEVFVETRRRLDIMNVGSIIDKYFSDTLTAYGIIEDDDYKHIPQVSFSFGGLVDKEHVLVTITEIEKRKESKPMRVLLDEKDIQAALTNYVNGLGLPGASGVKLEAINNVITAEVMFLVTDESPAENDPDATPDPAPKKRGRGGRPKGSKNLPKIEPKEDDDVGTPVQDGAAGSSTGTADAPEAEASEPSASDDNEEIVGESPKTGGTKKGNLFGDKGSQSSETNLSAEATPAVAPEPPVTEEPKPKKKGSIFDE